MPEDLIVLAHPGLDVNAAVVCRKDGTPAMVLLGLGQTFDNAVGAIHKVVPSLHPDEVRRKVRAALPGALKLGPMTFVEHAPVIERPPRTPPVTITVFIAVGMASIVGLGIFAFAVRAAAAVRGPAAAVMDARPVVHAAGLRCRSLSSLNMQCTDPAGGIVAVESSARVVTLDWSEDRVMVRQFPSAEEAEEFVEQKATRKLTPEAIPAGRYVVWGTDPERLQRAAQGLLEDAGIK